MMNLIATLAVLLSVGASAVVAGGQVAAPAMAAGPRSFQLRQTNRDQVVRRMTHGMRRLDRNKRQAQASAVASRCGGPSSFLLQLSGLTGDARGYNDQYAVFRSYLESDETFNIVPTAAADQATTFGMTDSCAFSTANRDFVANIAEPDQAQAIFFDTPGTISEYGYTPSTCKIVGESFTCGFEGQTGFAICPDGDNPWFIAAYDGSVLPVGCEALTLNAMSV